MSLALAEAGSNIIIPDINIDLAKKTAKEIEKKGVKALAVKMDVRNKEKFDSMVRVALDSFGKIDVLINDAGIWGLYSTVVNNLPKVKAALRKHPGKVINVVSITEKVVNSMEKCKVISRYGIGVDGID